MENPTESLRWEQCESTDIDAGQCKLRAGHGVEHIGSTASVIFTWSEVPYDLHVYPADHVERWITQAPWWSPAH